MLRQQVAFRGKVKPVRLFEAQEASPVGGGQRRLDVPVQQKGMTV